MAATDPQMSASSSDDEIDLLEVASAFRRRWIWIAGGGLLGLAIAGIPTMLQYQSYEKPLPIAEIRLTIDTSQGPCSWTSRKFPRFGDESKDLSLQCIGEFDSARRELTRIAFDELRPGEVISMKVQPVEYGSKKNNNIVRSDTALELLVETEESRLNEASSRVERIKERFVENRINNYRGIAPEVAVGTGWIDLYSNLIEQTSVRSSLPRLLALGLLGGFVLGSGVALIVDRKSDRVFSKSRILGQLGFPLWLSLPALPWSEKMVSPLIGQLAARLDASLEWRVLSIAHENEVVGALAQGLLSENESGLSCKAVDPLLTSIIRSGSDAKPIGLLIVVESGFNSSKALDEARLLLKQLPFVQSIGVVLVGVPLPSEMVVAEKA